MGKITLVTGGARSGKSRFAESKAGGYQNVNYIATAIAFDEEMKARIARHQSERPENFVTCEGYRDLGRFFAGADAVLLDCVTLMITNLMMDCPADWDQPTQEDARRAEQAVTMQTDALISAAKGFDGDTYLVTNELGMGLVPAYPFGRIFRDIAGRVNQKLAGAADEVVLLISGIPIKIK